MASGALKIGLVLDDSLDKTDGVQQYILTIGDWLTRQGHEVHYLVGQSQRSDVVHLHSLSRNMNVRFNGNRMSMPLPTSSRKLRDLLLQEKFDLLHIQMPYSPFLAHKLIRLSGPETAVVGTFHIVAYSGLERLANRFLALWLRSSLKRFDEVVSVSAAAQQFAKQVYRLDSEVLPNVIDYERFHKAEPFPQYNDAKPTILFLGRLVPRKGCLVLLQAVAELVKKTDLPPFRVLICGRGPLEAQLKGFVRQSKLIDIVEFTGFVSEADKPRYYASADIAVFPSRGGESFGIVLAEAMASGQAAILAGNNAGYAAVLGERPEMLFPPNDSSQLAEKIKGLLFDKRARQESAKWGEDYARQFSVATVGQKLIAVYNQALRKRRSRDIM